VREREPVRKTLLSGSALSVRINKQQGCRKIPMNPDLFAPDLQRVLSFILKHCVEAAIDGDVVVILNADVPAAAPPAHNIRYRSHRVRTLAEAWAALEICGLVRERRSTQSRVYGCLHPAAAVTGQRLRI
jgi:hypothetical protein